MKPLAILMLAVTLGSAQPELPKPEPLSESERLRFLLYQREYDLLVTNTCAAHGLLIKECALNLEKGTVQKRAATPEPPQ
jgi:hypothetical protein